MYISYRLNHRSYIILVVNKRYQSNNVQIDDEWEYKNPQIIFQKTESEEIVWCTRKKAAKKRNRLDFFNVIVFCDKQEIIKDKKIIEDLQSLRTFRN